MSADPACAFATEPNLTEQYLVDHGHLANVFVYIKAGAPDAKAPAGAAPVILDQKGCRYLPHVIALQQGGTVEFRNSDPTMHNIHTMPTRSATRASTSRRPHPARPRPNASRPPRPCFRCAATTIPG